MSEKYCSKPENRYDESDPDRPSTCTEVDMIHIGSCLIEKPSDHDSEDRVEVVSDCSENSERKRTKRKSSDRKEEYEIIKHEKKSDRSLRHEKAYIGIFRGIFLESLGDFLDFRHFSL
jgi:hypothetical protein